MTAANFVCWSRDKQLAGGRPAAELIKHVKHSGVPTMCLIGKSSLPGTSVPCAPCRKDSPAQVRLLDVSHRRRLKSRYQCSLAPQSRRIKAWPCFLLFVFIFIFIFIVASVFTRFPGEDMTAGLSAETAASMNSHDQRNGGKGLAVMAY